MQNNQIVKEVMKELLDRYPHLRTSCESMIHEGGAESSQFAEDALSAFRQHFKH